WRTGQSEISQVQRLGIKSGFPNKEKTFTGKGGPGERRNEEAIEFAVERSDKDAILFGLSEGVVGGEIKKVLAVGEKERPAMGGVEFSIELGDRGRSPSRGGDLVQGVAHVRGKDDDVARAPGTAPRGRCIAQTANRSGGDVEGLKPAVGKEAQTRAVWRPEGETC